MKNINEISNIISNMTEEDFERINNADFERWDLDNHISRNAKRRLVRNLAKHNLTLDEWDAWENI